jgi:hypothetical protein
LHTYDGVPTDQECSEIDSLRERLSSGILVMMFGQSRATLGQPGTRYSGRVTDKGLHTHIGDVEARLPWQAITAHASSSAVILLLAGQTVLPITRSFFATEEAWQLARRTIQTNVPEAPTARPTTAHWRTVVLWLALLIVIFLAWQFAQAPRVR